MVTNITKAEHCQYPDKVSAQKGFFKNLQKKTNPRLFLYNYNDLHLQKVFWLAGSLKKNALFILPAFGKLDNDALFFAEDSCVELKNGSFFFTDNYYIAVKDAERGLSIRRLSIIDSSEILAKVAHYWKYDDYTFLLCKAYERSLEHKFIAYVWSGYHYDEEDDTQIRILLPVFTEDDPLLTDYSYWDLHYTVMNPGDVLCHNSKGYIVRSRETGVYLDELPFILSSKERRP